MWNLVSVCLENVLVSVQGRCMVCAKHTIVSEIVSDAPMVLLGDKAQVELVLVRFEVVQILMQDRCMVCAEPTIGLKIILNAPYGNPR